MVALQDSFDETPGIAHREAGIGRIGAGLTRASLACFTGPLAAFARPRDTPAAA